MGESHRKYRGVRVIVDANKNTRVKDKSPKKSTEAQEQRISTLLLSTTARNITACHSPWLKEKSGSVIIINHTCFGQQMPLFHIAFNENKHRNDQIFK